MRRYCHIWLSYLEVTFVSYQFFVFHSVSLCGICVCLFIVHVHVCVCMYVGSRGSLQAVFPQWHSITEWLLIEPGLTDLATLAGQWAPCIWCPTSPKVTDCCHCPCFYVALTDLNSCPFACKTSTFSNEHHLMSSPCLFFLLSRYWCMIEGFRIK